MNPDMLRLLAATATTGAVLLAATSAFAGDWKKGRGHKHHHHHHHGEEVIVIQQRPVVYAPRPVIVHPSPMGYAPVYEPRYAPVYGPAYAPAGNLSIGVNVPLR